MLSSASLRALFQVAALAQHRRALWPSHDTRSVSLRWRGSGQAVAAPRSAAFVAPCSLGASPAAPEPSKRSGLRPHLFYGGIRAPFVQRPCLVARPAVFFIGALKRIVFSPPHRRHLSPHLRTCPPTRHPLVASSSGAPPQGHRRPRSFVPTHNPTAPQSARPSGGVGLPGATGRVVLITRFVVKLWLLGSGEG